MKWPWWDLTLSYDEDTDRRTMDGGKHFYSTTTLGFLNVGTRFTYIRVWRFKLSLENQRWKERHG